eukprot:473618-Rhodomonas_salina.2
MDRKHKRNDGGKCCGSMVMIESLCLPSEHTGGSSCATVSRLGRWPQQPLHPDLLLLLRQQHLHPTRQCLKPRARQRSTSLFMSPVPLRNQQAYPADTEVKRRLKFGFGHHHMTCQYWAPALFLQTSFDRHCPCR